MSAVAAIEARTLTSALELDRAVEVVEGARVTSAATEQEHEATRVAFEAAVPVLALEGISLAFGGVVALCDIDLRVVEGEIRAVIGPNGAGKSSLLNVVSGLYRPDRGQVRLGESRFAHVPTSRLAEYGVLSHVEAAQCRRGIVHSRGGTEFDGGVALRRPCRRPRQRPNGS
jgi:ABC-type transport system involved in cytochrome bd biosynthesis fused ATPase/permease subunit